MIDKLEFFIAVAREQSFSRAADVCGVTQPTLSAGIKQLEDTLGVLLVNRSSRFHGLTPEGERVLEWAKRIVGDSRAMRQEVRALKSGLTGLMRIAVIPTALSMVAALTTPFRAKHPGVRFSVVSATSQEILQGISNLEIDAGITYLDNEPLGTVRSLPLYIEQYRLLTSAGSPFADHKSVTWADVGRIPLCLLTPDMQNRRIVDQLLASSGNRPEPTLESNSVIALYAHVKTGQWSSIMAEKLVETLSVAEPIRSIPIIEPQAVHQIGLVVPRREPMTPLTATLFAEAKKLIAPQL
ncbi:LysR family transcriptional regulator [uncultured Methylovirgula sp.]|uniref:LysR family transcriptional regulator n=1 Tax=uncultured Methylovirgula sp. TaxID=1285960 RepID=UPI00260AE78E|nr:LysR family transcriptional regulator [uncultured Methylovirgula sp.]